MCFIYWWLPLGKDNFSILTWQCETSFWIGKEWIFFTHYKKQLYNQFLLFETVSTRSRSTSNDIVSLAHNVSFWIQKIKKWAKICLNGFFLFLLNSYIIQSMFKLFFLFVLARILEKTIGIRNWKNLSVSGPRNWHYGREILYASNGQKIICRFSLY